MIICDRCGNKIAKMTEETTVNIIRYNAQAAYIGHNVHLCDDCRRKLKTMIGKAESYFMENKENPFDIFDNVKYWNKDL